MNLLFSAVAGQFDEAMLSIQKPMANAATAAIHDVGDQVKREGRAAIAAAGFSKKWQNGFRVNTYPERGVSIDAVVLAYHKIGYAGVFESGASISGRPYLWLPLPGLAKRIGRDRMTPKNFAKTVGRLYSMRRPAGKAPLLGAYMAGKIGSRVTLGKLRAGTARRNGTGISSKRKSSLILVPIFVGIARVKLRARFGMEKVFARGNAALGALYLRHLKEE